MWLDDDALQRSSLNALAAYQRDYTAGAAYIRLLDIYGRAGVPQAILEPRS